MIKSKREFKGFIIVIHCHTLGKILGTYKLGTFYISKNINIFI